MAAQAVRLLQNSTIRLANFGLGLVISFFMMPFLVRHLGDQMYGVWTLVGSVLGYYGLIDLGLSSAVVRFISRAVGRGDKSEVRAVFCTSFYLFATMGVAALLLTVTLAWGLVGVVKDPGDLRLFRWLLLILGINFSFDFPVRAFNAVFSSNIRDDISVGIGMVKTLLGTAFVVAAIRSGHGVLALAVITVFASALDSVTRVVIAYRMEPAATINPAFIDWSRVRALFSYSTYSFVSRIGDILQFRVDHLVITAYVGLAGVTHFFVAGRLVEYLKDVLSQSIRGMTPVFSQDEGRNDFDAIRRKFFFVSKLTGMVATYGVGCAVAFGRPFIETWMGTRFLDAYPVLVVLSCGMYFRLAQLPAVPLLYGVSKHKYHAYSTVAEGAANLFLSVVLAQRYGILGVAIGTALPMLATTIFVQPWYVARVGGFGWGRYLGFTARNLSLCASVFLLVWMLSRVVVSVGYPALFVAGGIQTLLYWPLVLLFGLNRGERAHLFETFRRALPFRAHRLEPLSVVKP